MPKRKNFLLPELKFYGKEYCFFWEGKKIYAGTSAEEAQKKFLRFFGKIFFPKRHRGGMMRKKILVQDLILRYMDQPHDARETSKKKRAMRILFDLYGETAADEFGAVKFRAVRKEMIAQNLSYSYINDLMAHVRALFFLGVELEMVPESVAVAVSIVKPLRRGEAKTLPPRQAADDTDIEKTLPFLSQTIASMVQILRRSGMRPSELFAMTAERIDRSGKVWLYTPAKSKSERFARIRTIGLGTEEQELLRDRIEKKKKDQPLFQPIDAVMERLGHTPDRRTLRQLQDRYSKDSFRRAVSRGIEKARAAGVPVKSWTPYQLRHTAATEISAELGQEAARILLGHVSSAVTGRYDHSDREKISRLIEERTASPTR